MEIYAAGDTAGQNIGYECVKPAANERAAHFLVVAAGGCACVYVYVCVAVVKHAKFLMIACMQFFTYLWLLRCGNNKAIKHLFEIC